MRIVEWGTLTLLAAGCAEQHGHVENAGTESAAVDVEVARERALHAFDRQCARGTLECDGASANAPHATRSPPAGAAGFDFSMTGGDAERHCRAAGQMWSTSSVEAFSCTGSAGAPLPFHVDVFTCGGHLCRLVLSQHTLGIDAFSSAEKQLTESHGAPSSREVEVASDCSGSALADCIRSGRAKARVAWKWDAGYTLTATLQASAHDVFVFIAYSSPTFGESLGTRGL